jgi:hypothetical protein
LAERTPANGSIRNPVNGSIRNPVNGSIRNPVNGSIPSLVNGSIPDPSSESIPTLLYPLKPKLVRPHSNRKPSICKCFESCGPHPDFHPSFFLTLLSTTLKRSVLERNAH